MNKYTSAALILVALTLSACNHHNEDDVHHGHTHNYSGTCSEYFDDLILIRGAPDSITVTDNGSTYSTYWWYDDDKIRFEGVSHFDGTCTTYEFVDLSR